MRSSSVALSSAPVVIVGAGMAGLAAAAELRARGVPYRLLERAAVPGGRVRRAAHPDGGHWDCGAQFLAPPAPLVHALLGVAGLASELAPVQAAHAIVDGRGLHPVAHRAPLPLLRWLGLADASRVARGVAPRLLASYAEGFHDFGRAARWERAPGRGASDRALDRVLDPVLDGVFFLDARAESVALSHAVLAYLLRHPRFLQLRGGLGRLTETLGHALGVELGRGVRELVALPEGGVRVRTDDERFVAPCCVLAAPAHAAREILAEPTPEERAVLGATYAPAMVVAFSLRGRLPAPLADTFGVLFARALRTSVGSLSFPREGHVVVTTSAAETARLSSLADDAAVAEIVAALGRTFPALAPLLGRGVVHRWAHAIPRSPVGRASAVREYRRALDPRRPIRLAGDYTSYPNVESAAWSGRWAARELLRGARGG